MISNLHNILDKTFNKIGVYFYTIDYLSNKIVVFMWDYLVEISPSLIWKPYYQTRNLYIYKRDFNAIKQIFDFIGVKKNSYDISYLIWIVEKYESIIHGLLLIEREKFLNNTFNSVQFDKNILLILRWWWMEETIEKSFISFCNYNKLKLKVLYKFWTWYWGQKLNQDGFFTELKVNNPNVEFIYNEDFDDSYIDSIVDEYTEIFSFQYDYEWKHKNLNMIILSSIISRKNIDLSRYKNVFSCYIWNNIWYSSDRFINYDNVNIYKFFNPQNINLIRNFRFLQKSTSLILSWWMTWARDFSIINSLNWRYKWIMISDEKHNIKNFLSMYRWIQSYYGFFWAFLLSDIWVFCHLEEYNNDDRTKMIATCISSWRPVIVPHNEWKIVKDILDRKLWLSYINWNYNDFIEKINFFMGNKENLLKYSKNCIEYSNDNMDVNSFINFIFNKVI